jgi:hypothetical protein
VLEYGNAAILFAILLAIDRITPTGKPPPLAVRLAKALPFQRAQVEMRDVLTVHDDLHTADNAHAQVAMVSSNTARRGRG